MITMGREWGRGILAVGLAVLVSGAAASGSIGDGKGSTSDSVSDISYTVIFNAELAATRTIRVEMSFRTASADPVVLSLPAWTPGSYELDNFARHVSSFSASSPAESIRWDMVDYDSWRVHPSEAGEVTVGFDFEADTMDVGMAWTAPDFAYFNGTNLFLFPEGQELSFPARVTIHTEPDWLIATGLDAAGGPGEFSAQSYHEVVDRPVFIGRFDLDSAEVEGTMYRLATYPEGTMAGEIRAEMWEDITAMMPPMSAVFGDTPWDSYTTLLVFDAGFPGGSALEHGNSHLGTYATGFVGTWILSSITAHEIFHAWNVKRLRPAGLWPYDYGRSQPTPLLWVSEGITDYYADLALVRGGIIPAEQFLAITAGKMGTVAQVPPVALEDASLSTWIEPTDGSAFVYYPKGSLAGLMLDVLIRDATDNRRSLDDVMRAMYEKHFLAGEGFTTEDWWTVVSQVAGGRSFEEFAAKYVDGRDPYPWAEILPLAGLTMETDTVSAPRIGIGTGQDSVGVLITGVAPGSMAASAGIEAGDYLLRIGDVEVSGQEFGAQYRERYTGQPAGQMLEIIVLRDGAEIQLSGPLAFAENISSSLETDSDATAKAARIREGILTGTTD
ncbi:MAG: PDZ domain-containing protein [Gemmatimonadota bacterium]